MNIEKYNSGVENLFVIMQTVTNNGRFEKTGNDTDYYTFLNMRGVFAKSGTPEEKIFTWNDRQIAEAAALIVRKRKSFSARALTISESGCYLVNNLIEFNEQHESALTNYLNSTPFINAKARRVNGEKVYSRILFHASKLLELTGATSDEMRIIQKKINAQNPGWSISSSTRSLLGKKSMETIERIRLNEIQMNTELTVDRLEQAIMIANKFFTNKNKNV